MPLRLCVLLLLRIEVAEAPGGLEYPVMIRATPSAHAQMNGRPGETLARISTAELDLNVLVHDRSTGIAARVAWFGPQKVVELVRGRSCRLLLLVAERVPSGG